MTNETAFRPSRHERRLLFTLPGETSVPDGEGKRPSESPQKIVLGARDRYSYFYRSANTEDTYLMDDLILARAALVRTSSVPADNLDPLLCERISRAVAHLEQVFSILARGVRECPTFSRLDVVDQAELEHSVLQIVFPGAKPFWTLPSCDDPSG